jgi:glutathione peroxidase
MSIYATSISGLDGTPNALAQAEGKVTLLVNVASKCGLTPQYETLEQLQKNYSANGFTVVGVPCNQFLGQEPGTAEEIQSFCSTTYGISFPLTEKIDVNGDNRHALYTSLTPVADAEGESGDIRWNFEKFLIGRNGEVIARFHPKTAPDAPEVISAIEGAL